MTYQENIKKYIQEGYIGKDLTCNGKCTKCGECCGSILPIDQEDANKIQDYVVEHQIFLQRQMLVMCQKLQCPYYTGKKDKGCAIYEARPKICKYYQCNKKTMPIEELRTMIEAIPVDMWEFALAIEKEMKKNGINKKTGKTIKKSI